MAIDKATAAALLEFEQYGRFTDPTREALAKAAGVGESDDDAKASSTTGGKTR